MFRYGALAIVCFMLLPLAAHAQENNVGFVQGLWYSTDHVFAGTQMRIYVAVRNYTGSDLTGTVSFLDGAKTIGTQHVQALDGRIIETWADWSPAYGTHTVSANLSRIELSRIGSTTRTVTTTSGLAQDTLFVDRDTDNDGVGNNEDTDDDGDTLPDTQEIADGTDPLIPNAKKEASADTHDASAAKDTESSSPKGEAADSPQGIEQYLDKGPAEEALSSVTQLISQTKQSLDTYRAARDQKQYEETHPKNLIIDAQGFGPITRTIASDPNKPEFPKLQGNTALEKALSAGKWLLNTLYSWALSSASFMLGHPVFMQLLLLICILLVVMRLAAKFGRRRRRI